MRDTAAAILENNIVLSNVIAKQEAYIEYGGVVPELVYVLIRLILFCCRNGLKKAGIEKTTKCMNYTRGPPFRFIISWFIIC